MALNSAGPEKPQWHESDVEPITTGGNSSSTQRWNGVPRGTMDEVSSHVCLDLPTRSARPPERSFHLIFESYDGRAYVPIPKRSASPRAISTPQVNGLKALDPKRPIREADI